MKEESLLMLKRAYELGKDDELGEIGDITDGYAEAYVTYLKLLDSLDTELSKDDPEYEKVKKEASTAIDGVEYYVRKIQETQLEFIQALRETLEEY